MGRTKSICLKLLSVIGIFITISCLYGCSDKKKSMNFKLPDPSVQTYPVTQQSINQTYRIIGRTEAINKVFIVTKVEGFLDKQLFKEGQAIKKGQVLFVLDKKPFINQLHQAQASLKGKEALLNNAEKNLTRSKQLFDKGKLISQAMLDQAISNAKTAQANVAEAQANLESAKLNLNYTEIKAPFAGFIGKVNYSIGSLINSSQALAKLTSTDPIAVNFQVNEKNVFTYKKLLEQPNTKLILWLPDGSQYPYTGTFKFADNIIDPQTGSMFMQVTFPNPKNTLAPGLYVTLLLKQTIKKPQLVVPKIALQQNQLGYFVFVINKNNQVVSKAVTVGQEDNAMQVIKSGLQLGDNVVVQGLQSIRPHITVSPEAVKVDPKTGAITPLNKNGNPITN